MMMARQRIPKQLTSGQRETTGEKRETTGRHRDTMRDNGRQRVDNGFGGVTTPTPTTPTPTTPTPTIPTPTTPTPTIPTPTTDLAACGDQRWTTGDNGTTGDNRETPGYNERQRETAGRQWIWQRAVTKDKGDNTGQGETSKRQG